jgi:3-phenylpropionate/cinnamic acid dioxygenase small subunit
VSDTIDAIANLIATYAELMDNGDFAGVAALLSDAALGVLGEPGQVVGRDAIFELFRSTVRIYEDGTPRTKHVTSNIQVEADDDAGTAMARSYFTVFQATSVLPLQAIVAGRYHDRFLWRDGRWRFVERRFRTELVGDVSQHLLGGPEVLRAPETP